MSVAWAAGEVFAAVGSGAADLKCYMQTAGAGAGMAEVY